MIPLIASLLCGSKGCYKTADILVYRNKKKVYVCKEHNKKPERDNQLEIFNGTNIPPNTIR